MIGIPGYRKSSSKLSCCEVQVYRTFHKQGTGDVTWIWIDTKVVNDLKNNCQFEPICILIHVYQYIKIYNVHFNILPYNIYFTKNLLMIYTMIFHLEFLWKTICNISIQCVIYTYVKAKYKIDFSTVSFLLFNQLILSILW